MNRIFRTIWSVAMQSWQAVPENAKSAGKKSKSTASGSVAATVLGLMLSGGIGAQSPPALNQLPTGGQLVKGNASFSQTSTAQAAAMTVNQTSQRAIVHWDTFNLGEAASIQFVQPNAQASVLNRVSGSNPSQIFGRISANGQVFLTNPQGVYFSPTSSVDVGALTATTHSISDDNFMSGQYVFERKGSTAKVVNEGRIGSALRGYVTLLAPEVQNAGVVVARAGTVAMAAGELITLKIDDLGGLANITTTPSTMATLIENRQAVQAPDGQIILSAVALNKLQAGVIKNSGTLEASSLVSRGGKIYLEGDDITLASTSKIEAKGPTGGGTVLVGGDWQGTGTMHQARQVTMQSGATIDTSATERGDGGKVVLWSDIHNTDSLTTANGSIKTEAGPNGGNGGQVETSGHYLDVGGITVSTNAPRGLVGEWLLDPYNITIGTAASGTTWASGGVTAGTPSTTTYTSAASSTILATDIANALANNNVTIKTGGVIGDGFGNGDITVSSSAPITKTSGSATTLKLVALQNISVGAAISGSTNHPLNVVLASRATGGTTGKITISAPIKTYGGDVTLGGGDENASGFAIANGATTIAGVEIASKIDASGSANGTSNNTLPTGNTGGNIVIRGKGNTSTLTTYNWGIHAKGASAGSPASILTDGPGGIYLEGYGGLGATAGMWSVASVGVVFESNVYIKSNTGNITIKGYAGTGGDKYGIASTEASKMIGTNGGLLFDGDSLLIRNGTLTVSAGSASDIKAPILSCSNPSYCSASTFAKSGSGVLNLWGDAQAWNNNRPANTAAISANGTFSDTTNSVNLVNLTRAQALASFSTVPTTINTVTNSSAFALYIKQTATSGSYGGLSFTYQVVDAAGNPITLNAGSYQNLDITGSNPVYSLTTTAPVGTYSVSYQSGLTLTGTSASTYHLSPYATPTSFVVTPRPITLTANAVNKIYGNADPTLGVTVTSGSTAATDTLSDVTGTLTRSAGENVGRYDVALGAGTKASNYAITFAANNQALTIDPRPITIAANNQHKIYGNADPALTASITAGSLASVTVTDTLSDVTGTLSRTAGENAGSYDVALGAGTKASNYAITFAANNQALTIDPRPLSITGQMNFSGQPSLDTTRTGTTLSATNLVGNDAVSLSGTATLAAADAGTQALTNMSGLQQNNPNYTLTGANGSVNVIPLQSIQVRPLTNQEVGVLIGSQLAGLSSNQIGSFSASQLQVFSGQQIGSLSAVQLSGLTETQIGSLNEAQIKGITPAQITLLSAAQINGMTPTQVSALTVPQLQALSSLQVNAISPQQLSLLTPTQISLITDNAATPLSFQQVFSLAPTQIAAVSAVQMARMTAAEMGSLNDAQLQSLTTAQLTAVAPKSLSALSPEQLILLSAAQLTSLAPVQLAELTAIQVASLQPYQMEGMSALQLAAMGIYPQLALEKTYEAPIPMKTAVAMTAPKVAGMTGLQIRALTADQLNALPKEQLTNLSPSQVQALTTAQLSQLTSEQAGNLTKPQLSVMSKTQLEALPVRTTVDTPTQTGVLSVTFLQGTEAPPVAKGVVFEQSADVISLKATTAPVAPVFTDKTSSNDAMTTFTVTTGSGEKIEFQGGLVNNRIVIVAGSKQAKAVVRDDTNLVLVAALTSLGKENSIVLTKITGILIDLR